MIMKNKDYEKWLMDNFDIQITEENEKYFYGVIRIDSCYDNYCSNVLAFKGDPLISFLICDIYIYIYIYRKCQINI